MSTHEIKVTACPYPCENCRKEATLQAPNYLHQSVGYASVFCLLCWRSYIQQGNAARCDACYILLIEPPPQPTRAAADAAFGAPLAVHSEWRPGDLAHYETAGQRLTGEVLHVVEGACGGQFYIIENIEQGFPDVVPARELMEE